MIKRLAAAFMALTFATLTFAPRPAMAAGPAAVPAVDAPEMAALGPWGVGVERLTMTEADQPDPLAPSSSGAPLPRHDRVLPIEVWYPAKSDTPGAKVTYADALGGENGRPVAFTAPGLAVRAAKPAAGRFPLVILAHGYGGTPLAMTWLAENLASKGYVVVAPHFRDPPYGDAAGFIGPLTRRPLDIAFVAARAQAEARARHGPFAAADPSRVALIGYSMGGYGVLTAAGGGLAPSLGAITKGALAPYVVGGPRAGDLKVADVVAVVAISPAGLFAGAEAWGPTGLAAVTAPTLIIVGDQDHVVGYDPGPRTLWSHLVHAPHLLLTFENGGHSLGMDPAPPQMRGALWDQDWFEDPVWRKERVVGVQLHMITAFLGLHVKGEADKAAYLAVATPRSNAGVWPPAKGRPWSAYSPGPPAATLWKGFQSGHAAGLRLDFVPSAPP